MIPILAIDPGTESSGWVRYGKSGLMSCGIDDNSEMLSIVAAWNGRVAIEMIASYGMAVGREVFETCVWIGRMVESAEVPADVIRIERREIKLALCESPRAKDTNIRQALLDRFGGSGAVGTKKNPGPLYEVKSHIWAALAVAVVVAEKMQ